jgi:hypothetical protein
MGAARGVLIAVAVSLAAAAPVRAADAVRSFGIGDKAFWAGSFISSGHVSDPQYCGVQAACFDYPLRVTAANAQVLRAAIETSDDSNGWGVHILDPGGKEVAYGSTYQAGGFAENYDAEVFVHHPVAGVYTLRVVPENVEMGEFKVRAAVDPAQDSPPVGCTTRPAVRLRLPKAAIARGVERVAVVLNGKQQPALRGRHKSVVVSLKGLAPGTAVVRLRIVTGHGTFGLVRHVSTCLPSAKLRAGEVSDLPPNLAADAPWHLTFEQPPPMLFVEGGNYTATLANIHNPTMQLAGVPIYKCLPEETLEQHAKRCLRFTSGFATLGPGEFQVFGAGDSSLDVLDGGPLYQIIYRSDGSTRERRAGEYKFHPIHLHFHVLGIAAFTFFHVDPETHALTEAGKVLKEGFCLGNIKMYDWESFNQVEPNPYSLNNCQPTRQPDGKVRIYEGMANGWEDSYKWATSGQYIDFADNPDGYYLLRVVVNPDRTLLETDYSDNTAYAYVQIHNGNQIRMIERGHGESPWDPGKSVEDPIMTQ